MCRERNPRDAHLCLSSDQLPERGGALITIRFLIGVRDRAHLANVIRRLRRISAVEKVERF